MQLAEKFNQIEVEGRQLGEVWYEATEFKIHATEIANQIAAIALDVTGGYGYKKGPLERIYRDVRAGLVLAPSNHLARELVAKEMVGLPPELWTQGGE
ncbi:hypothetical protein D3C84_995960 [compost metagenome]